jgi:protein-disulfide isomerase
MLRTVPSFLACATLLALASVALTRLGESAWEDRQVAMLAGIEPAEGGAAAGSRPDRGSAEEAREGEAKPSKAFNGKVLSAPPGMPSITIGGLKVETSADLKQEAEAAFTPVSLRQGAVAELLARRFHFTPYAHDATRGPADAPVTLVEFSDLSCLQCMDDLKAADLAYSANAAQTREIQVYLPVERLNPVNLAAFYGKVAQNGGKFWEFRQALFDLKEPSPEAYFQALVQAGVAGSDARRWLTTEARRFYRELDADAQLAHAMGLSRPPHYFVNGIHVGDGGIPRDRLADVLTYELNYQHYHLDTLARHD